MSIETIQMYRTSDGKTYNTLAEAQQREEVLEIMREMPSGLDLRMECDREEMAEWILDNFNVVGGKS